MMTTIPQQSIRQHYAALYRLGFPLVAAQMAQMAIHATDIAMVGRIGAPELAATALATNYFFLIYMFGSARGAAFHAYGPLVCGKLRHHLYPGIVGC
jgi:Na+-driven multidrug efflux pump